ncbi:MAG: TIGR02647 family protein [Methylococcaceae bacterium]|nr:TIGR02647 family protein [Methylococcaceae bacterium]
MLYDQTLLDELNVLARYNLNTTQEGIKIHKDAAPEVIAAAERLFDKGLIDHNDGGYLTHLGLEVAEKAQSVLTTLSPK